MALARRSPRPIYLDYQATTPVDQRVVTLMVEMMTTMFGNANSREHAFGLEAMEIVDTARREVASLVEASPEDVLFCSGASEGLRLAIDHFLLARSAGPLRVVVSPVEHPAVYDALESLPTERTSFEEVAVNRRGQVDLESLAKQLKDPADLVCIMAANNEIGTIYPTQQIAGLARRAGALTLVDGTQAVGKIPVRYSGWGLTYLVLSAHKLYGPKGIGALVGPRFGKNAWKRQATHNVPGIAGLGEACRLRQLEMKEDEALIRLRRDRLQASLLSRIPDLVVNGDPAARLAGSLHISISGVPADAILARLLDQVAISTGAACSSGAEQPSHVLAAIGLDPALAEGSMRISLGKPTSDRDIDTAIDAICYAISGVRALVGA
ncbi:MAG: cysteine desulfurase family protein [Pseudomonadota bacterium]